MKLVKGDLILHFGQAFQCGVDEGWPHVHGDAFYRFSLRLCVMKNVVRYSCCTKDEGRPLGSGSQILESNNPMRPLLRARVVSDREKAERESVMCVLKR